MTRLQAEGHTITCLSVWDCRQKVESMGFRYLPLPNVDFSSELCSSDSLRSSFKYRLISLFKGNRISYEQGKEILNISSFEQTLRDLAADLVLSTMELHEVILTAKRLNIPVMIISDWYSFTRRKGLPPIRTAIIPGERLSGSALGVSIAWLFTKARIFARSTLNVVLLKANRKSVLIKYAKEAGFRGGDLISRNFPSVFIYRNMPTLSMTMREMEFPHDFAPNIHYIGPMVSVDRPQDGLSPTERLRLMNLFAMKRQYSKKIIYLSMSTLRSVDSEFFQKAVKAVTGQADWILIMTTAGNEPGQGFKDLPENVHYFKWLPQLTVLEQVDCSINHGGINTINECIHFGVPMLVYSGKQYDQSGCAARVHFHKLGIMGNESDTAGEMRLKLEKILHQSSYKTAVDEMRLLYLEQQKRPVSPYFINLE